jgi:CBS domain-containing protein
MVRMIAHLNDQILLRLIALLRQDRFTDLPERFAFVVLGSEGRGEQTLLTDQDNAIVYGDELAADEIMKIEEFSQVLIDSLIAIGIPPCAGGIMANNKEWRRSLGKWQDQLDRWLQAPTPEARPQLWHLSSTFAPSTATRLSSRNSRRRSMSTCSATSCS